jgi:hypothetical protein
MNDALGMQSGCRRSEAGVSVASRNVALASSQRVTRCLEGNAWSLANSKAQNALSRPAHGGQEDSPGWSGSETPGTVPKNAYPPQRGGRSASVPSCRPTPGDAPAAPLGRALSGGLGFPGFRDAPPWALSSPAVGGPVSAGPNGQTSLVAFVAWKATRRARSRLARTNQRLVSLDHRHGKTRRLGRGASGVRPLTVPRHPGPAPMECQRQARTEASLLFQCERDWRAGIVRGDGCPLAAGRPHRLRVLRSRPTSCPVPRAP